MIIDWPNCLARIGVTEVPFPLISTDAAGAGSKSNSPAALVLRNEIGIFFLSAIRCCEAYTNETQNSSMDSFDRREKQQKSAAKREAKYETTDGDQNIKVESSGRWLCTDWS